MIGQPECLANQMTLLGVLVSNEAANQLIVYLGVMIKYNCAYQLDKHFVVKNTTSDTMYTHVSVTQLIPTITVFWSQSVEVNDAYPAGSSSGHNSATTSWWKAVLAHQSPTSSGVTVSLIALDLLKQSPLLELQQHQLLLWQDPLGFEMAPGQTWQVLQIRILQYCTK